MSSPKKPNTRTQASSNSNDAENYIPMEIVYENKHYQIQAIKGESILSALERSRVSPDPNIRIPLPPIQMECRKGNCLTCSGRLLQSRSPPPQPQLPQDSHTTVDDKRHCSKQSSTCSTSCSLIRGEDGLSPYISKEIQNAGFVLLCSSFVVGEGLTIEIGCKEEAWDFVYYGKMTGQEAEYDRAAASAKSIRLTAEQNIPRWTEKTEQILKQTPLW